MVKSDILDILNQIARDNNIGLIVIENPNPTMLTKGSNVAARARNGNLYVPSNFNFDNWDSAELAHMQDVKYEIMDKISLIQDTGISGDCIIVESESINKAVSGKSIAEVESMLNCTLLKVDNIVFRQWEAKKQYRNAIIKTLKKYNGGK